MFDYFIDSNRLKDDFWDSLLTFVTRKMLPKYNGLLNGDMTNEGSQTTLPLENQFALALEQLFKAVKNKPEEVI